MDEQSDPGNRHDLSWVRGPLFEGLNEDEMQTILSRSSTQEFVAGDVLIQQDIWCGRLFILRSGVVQVSVEKAQEAGGTLREVPIRRMSTGDILGEGSLLSGAPPSATVRAVTSVEALVLSQEDFLHLIAELPTLSRQINYLLGRRLRSSNMQMAEREPQQVIIGVGQSLEWSEIACVMARLACAPTLFIDLYGTSTTDLTVSDLLSGRVHAGGEDGSDLLTVVRGVGCPISDLASLLRSAGEEFRFVLLAISEDDLSTCSQLAAFAHRVLVAGPADGTEAIAPRAREIAAFDGHHETAAVLTGAPQNLPMTVASLEVLSARAGVPIVSVLPSDPETAAPRFEALGRWLIGRRVGLALGAGGAKGWAHIGAIRALRRAGVPIDVVAGVSIGAILGAALAMGRSDAWIEQALGESLSKIVRPTIPYRAILTNRPLGRWFRHEIYGDAQIEDTPIPLAISAADLNEGSEVILRRGPIWQAVLASAAIPGIYPAVRMGNHFLVDGGVVNPVPVATTRLLGADVVVAVDLSVPLSPRHEIDPNNVERQRSPHLVNTILRSRDIMMSVIQARSVADPSVLVKPSVQGLGLRNFGEGSRFMDAGEEAMEKALPAIRRQLPWLGAES